jgi:hypothetical protein
LRESSRGREGGRAAGCEKKKKEERGTSGIPAIGVSELKSLTFSCNFVIVRN